jgi:hypothetical protein
MRERRSDASPIKQLEGHWSFAERLERATQSEKRSVAVSGANAAAAA